jgi:uncharacterized protein YndB with AHSA1/START domain
VENDIAATNNKVLFTRLLRASRELAWKAWTEPERVKQWWGPRTFSTPVVQIDLRKGGRYLYCMRSPDGKEFWSTGIFTEVRAPERLVVTDSFADEKGNIVSASHYGMDPNWPLEAEVAMTLEDAGGKTLMKVTYSGRISVANQDLKNMKQGWEEMLDKLEEYLDDAR